jgi:hypothetical protein
MVLVPFALTYPGSSINIPDRDEAFRVSTLLSLIEASLVEAALALGGYLHTRSIKPRRADPTSWALDAQLRQQTEEKCAPSGVFRRCGSSG